MNQTLNINLPIISILGITFIILKLTGTIDWSWWWVLSPFWIPIAIVLVLIVILDIIINR